MKLRVTGLIDAPDELHGQVPFMVDPIRTMAGRDRPDYLLGAVRSPLRWLASGRWREATHVVMATRYLGDVIEPRPGTLAVGIAMVIDPTLLDDDVLDLSKCSYIAIGVIEATE